MSETKRPKNQAPVVEAEVAQDPPDTAIGVRVRHTRLARELTLKMLAEKVGCSESLLSKIENGRANPSLKMIQKMAYSLDVTVGELLAPWDNSGSYIVREGTRPLIPIGQARGRKDLLLERLIPNVRGHLLQGSIHHVPPGAENEKLLQHQGEKFGYVLEGAIELTVAGQTHIVRQGDCFCFPSDQAHSYRNATERPAKILYLNTPPTF